MRRKRCQCCHELYEPEPRSYRRQKTCKKARCRGMRRRQAVQRWKARNPLLAGNNSVKQKQWRQSHRDYWRRWRSTHAGYVQRNRKAQRSRNAQRRRVIAKGNDLNMVYTDKSTQINALRLIAKGNDWQRATDCQIDGICRYLQGQLLIAKGNDIDTKRLRMRE
jgi:hypothetical protein